jgi:uncharacterized protein YecE (DUF72 family)
MSLLYFSGTSGILLPYKNKSFYPEPLRHKSRLAVYSMLFNSLEVNSSFYKVPLSNTVRRWSEEVTDNFRFTFKLWRGITHTKGFIFNTADVTSFMETIDAVGEKKGCLLVQLPPSTGFPSFARLQQLMEIISASNPKQDWKVCVEFRQASWYRAETYKLLDAYGVSMVFHDKSSTGLNIEQMETKFIYLRFHGPNGDFKGSYDDAFLMEYSYYIKDWLSSGKEVFVYFNNTIGEAIANVNLLKHYVGNSD